MGPPTDSQPGTADHPVDGPAPVTADERQRAADAQERATLLQKLLRKYPDLLRPMAPEPEQLRLLLRSSPARPSTRPPVEPRDTPLR